MNPVYSPGSSGVPYANAKGIGYPGKQIDFCFHYWILNTFYGHVTLTFTVDVLANFVSARWKRNLQLHNCPHQIACGVFSWLMVTVGSATPSLRLYKKTSWAGHGKPTSKQCLPWLLLQFLLWFPFMLTKFKMNKPFPHSSCLWT